MFLSWLGEVAASVLLAYVTNVTSCRFFTQLLLLALGVAAGVTIPLNSLYAILSAQKSLPAQLSHTTPVCYLAGLLAGVLPRFLQVACDELLYLGDLERGVVGFFGLEGMEFRDDFTPDGAGVHEVEGGS